MSLFSKNENHLGIDIGNSGVKIVELQKNGNKFNLLTYGFAELVNISNNDWQDDIKYTAKVIDKVLKKSKVLSSSAVAALPSFKIFSSVLSLPQVPKKDMEELISREAGEIMPMPVEEMILDWKKMNKASKKDKYVKIFVTGAPKKLVQSYIDLFKEANINLISLETESFSLIRSLLGKDMSNILIVEIGAGTTDIFISQKGIPVLSRSIDFGGQEIAKIISQNSSISIEEAEQFKKDLGNLNSEDGLPDFIEDAIKPIIDEMKYVLDLFSKKTNQEAEKIVLSGGSSLLPGLPDYLSQKFNLNTVIGDPWIKVNYRQELKPVLSEIGPRLAVAIGLAMREKE